MISVFGDIKNPFPILGANYSAEVGPNFGLLVLFNNILRLVFLAAGIFAFFQLIIAGYGFMAAAGDPKKVAASWAKIWQTLLGLVIIVGSFVLAAIIGQIFFGDPMAIIRPTIYAVIYAVD